MFEDPRGQHGSPAHLHGDGQQARHGHDHSERLIVAEADGPGRVVADPQGHEEVDQGGDCAVAEGLEKDPVVEELVPLACGVQLGQLQAPLRTHVLGWGMGEAAGSWDQVGSGGWPHPHTRPPGARNAGRPRKAGGGKAGSAHLLEEADVEHGQRAVQKVEEREEPAFVQRLAGETDGRARSAFRRPAARKRSLYPRRPPKPAGPLGSRL